MLPACHTALAMQRASATPTKQKWHKDSTDLGDGSAGTGPSCTSRACCVPVVHALECLTGSHSWWGVLQAQMQQGRERQLQLGLGLELEL